MIRIGHPYRDRALDAPPPSDEPAPNPFEHDAVAEMLAAGRRCARRIAIELDVTNRDEVERAIEKVREATRLGADARAQRTR